MVPKEHMVRKVVSEIDFSFIHGRSALDLALLFKLLLLGYLFGIRSGTSISHDDSNTAVR